MNTVCFASSEKSRRVGRGYRNAIDADTIKVASFFPTFTKSEYVSVGNGEKTQWEDVEQDKGINQLLLKKI